MSDAASPLAAPQISLGSGALGRSVDQARAILAQPAVRRSLPLLLGTLAIAAVAMIYILTRTPEMRPLFSELSESDKAGIIEALQSSNYAVEIDPTTGSILVAASDYHKARMALAAQGLPKAAPTGYDLLNNMPLGTSRAIEAARLKQSQESELSRSVAEIAGVKSARVHLALPEPSAFVRDHSPPSASVFVELAPGRAFSDAQVRSIVNLVASSVAGLPADRVSVVDQTGALLTADEHSDGLAEGRRRIDFQNRLEQIYRERLIGLLAPIVGRDNLLAEVRLDLDFTETQATREAWDKNNAVVRSEQGSAQTEPANGAAPRGVPGALSNIAPPAAQVSDTTAPAAPEPTPAAAPGPQSETYTRSYEIGKEISVTKDPVGKVRKLSVAVVVRNDSGTAAKDLRALEQLVRSAVGFDAARGDVVTVTSHSFATPTIEPQPWHETLLRDATWLPGLAKILAALTIFLLMYFAVLRPFLKRALAAPPAPADDAAALRLGAPDAQTMELLRARLQPRRGLPAELLTTNNSYDDKVAVVRMFVSEDTARASNVVKGLLRNDMVRGGNV